MSTRHVVCRTDGPDLAFSGTLVAQVDSRERKTDMHEWTVLQLYRTDRGAYVAVRERWSEDTSMRPGSMLPTIDWVEARACPDSAAVIAWLGWSWLTRLLYERGGIVPQERV